MGEAVLREEVLSVEEYFAREEKSEIRHEYWNGYVIAMAGNGEDHVTLSAQLVISLGNALYDKPCRVGGSDLSVKVEASNSYLYPDAVVWCKDAEFEGKYRTRLLTPVVVAEVLSPSTAHRDRGVKLEAYLQIPSLTDYLILSPEKVSVQHFARSFDGSWAYRHYVLRDQVIRLARLEIELTVGELYRQLDVPESTSLALGFPLDLPQEDQH